MVSEPFVSFPQHPIQVTCSEMDETFESENMRIPTLKLIAGQGQVHYICNRSCRYLWLCLSNTLKLHVENEDLLVGKAHFELRERVGTNGEAI